MKLPILLFAALVLVLAQTGCAFREKKSTAHTYIGDSPTITYGPRESAGGPITAH